MPKKIALLLLAIALCFLTACASQREVVGRILKTNQDEEGRVLSFVIRTDDDKDLEILVTDETLFFSFVEGVTADAFKRGSFSDVLVSVKYKKARHNKANEVEINGFLLSDDTSLSDGRRVEIWQHYNYTLYTLENGTELLRIRDLAGPDKVYVAGMVSFEDLEEEAQAGVLKFYQNQGLLYDAESELEKAYRHYLKIEAPSKFIYHTVTQDIALTASSDKVVYFLTSVGLPIDDNHGHEHRIGAAFDRKTGESMSNWDLFSCSSKEVIETVLDFAGVDDPILRKEMEMAFKAENIIFFPGNLEICFEQGSLPSQESSYRLSLDYDEALADILYEWAIPQKTE